MTTVMPVPIMYPVYHGYGGDIVFQSAIAELICGFGLLGILVFTIGACIGVVLILTFDDGRIAFLSFCGGCLSLAIALFGIVLDLII